MKKLIMTLILSLVSLLTLAVTSAQAEQMDSPPVTPGVEPMVTPIVESTVAPIIIPPSLTYSELMREHARWYTGKNAMNEPLSTETREVLRQKLLQLFPPFIESETKKLRSLNVLEENVSRFTARLEQMLQELKENREVEKPNENTEVRMGGFRITATDPKDVRILQAQSITLEGAQSEKIIKKDTLPNVGVSNGGLNVKNPQANPDLSQRWGSTASPNTRGTERTINLQINDNGSMTALPNISQNTSTNPQVVTITPGNTSNVWPIQDGKLAIAAAKPKAEDGWGIPGEERKPPEAPPRSTVEIVQISPPPPVTPQPPVTPPPPVTPAPSVTTPSPITPPPAQEPESDPVPTPAPTPTKIVQLRQPSSDLTITPNSNQLSSESIVPQEAKKPQRKMLPPIQKQPQTALQKRQQLLKARKTKSQSDTQQTLNSQEQTMKVLGIRIEKKKESSLSLKEKKRARLLERKRKHLNSEISIRREQ